MTQPGTRRYSINKFSSRKSAQTGLRREVTSLSVLSGHRDSGGLLGACSPWGAQGPRIHCARAADRGRGLDPQGGPHRRRVDTGGVRARAKVVLHVTQAGGGLVRGQAGHVPRSSGPGGQFLGTGMLHLGDRVVWRQMRMAALCGVGARHRVQPRKEQERKGSLGQQ